MRENEVSGLVLGSAIEVHRSLGPGLLESTYQECLGQEMKLRGLDVESQRTLPLEYKGIRLECGYRLDFLVERSVVVEVKAVDTLAPVHVAQVLTYLRIGGWRLGLLLNFNVPRMRDGIRRVVLGL